MVSLKLTRIHAYSVLLLIVGLMLAVAGLAQTSKQGDQDDVIHQIGNQFGSELQHIESIIYGLPLHDSSHLTSLKLTTDAQDDIKALRNEHRPVQAVPEDSPDVLSTNVQYVGYDILKQESKSTIVKYHYVITRETEDLKGGDAWQEAPEFVLVIDPEYQVVKDIDWITEDKAAAIVEDTRSDREGSGVASGNAN